MSAGMKCLETRQRNGMKWRRYRTEEGAIVTTYEVPTELLSVLGPARLREELQRAARSLERKRRNAKARALRAAGWKSEAVAAEVGLSASQVRRLSQAKQSRSAPARVLEAS